MIKRLTRRESVIFIICVAVVFLYIGFYGAVKPLVERIEAIDEEMLTMQNQIGRNLKVIKKAKALEEQYAQYIVPFQQTKSNEQVMASVLSEIESVAGKLELLISELKPQKVKHDEYSNNFSVSLTISSELVDIIRFLHTLQGQPHFFDVEEVRLDGIKAQKTSAVRARLVLSKILIPQGMILIKK